MIREMPADFHPEIREMASERRSEAGEAVPAVLRYAETQHQAGTLALGYWIEAVTDRAIGDDLLRKAIWQAMEILRCYAEKIALVWPDPYPETAQLRPRGTPPTVSGKITDAAARCPIRPYWFEVPSEEKVYRNEEPPIA